MKVKIYQVDAFTDVLFSGNPAAVCPLNSWLPDSVMQNIAMENNLAETAFFVPEGNNFHIRWFTPTVEVNLCGHATLASAHVLFNHDEFNGGEIRFLSRSGLLRVYKTGDLLTLDFPADSLTPVETLPDVLKAFDIAPVSVLKGKSDYMVVFENEEQVLNLRPNLQQISKLDARGIIATARGSETDFVSRFFAPQSGVDEDPVTGSAHTSLTPYWAGVLQKNNLTAVQLSHRKGYLRCENCDGRVHISGKARTFLIGEIEIQ
jgi:PhzF family phenazine biosynthesis protein